MNNALWKIAVLIPIFFVVIGEFHMIWTQALSLRRASHGSYLHIIQRRTADISKRSTWRRDCSTSTSKLSALGIDGFDSGISSKLSNILTILSSSVQQYAADIDKLVQSDALKDNIVNTINEITANPLSLPIWTLFVAGLVVGGLGSDDENLGSPYDDESNASYNYKKSEEFFSKRPLFVIRRLLRLARITGVFNIRLTLDYLTKRIDENMADRASEALELVTQLGPTFIKLGQALSIRTDLIPEPYALELRKLQDAVPPFSSEQAKEILRKELNVKDLKEVFKSISDKPIASASIGQVYRGRLIDGRDVAVKVQRPNILREIALDLYILRLITPLQVRISNAIGKRKTDQADIDVALSLVDEWGRGFVAEVDYQLEAKNGKDFCEAMKSRGLNAVTAPEVIDEYSGRRVLLTRWMDGTRLDKDASPDVPRLCGVALNAYLTMLLDTGVLHCDPHPGNLLRTTDGRLCILDWGMTLNVPKDLQYALLEFIAHINTENYDAIPEDFVNLGFSPANQQERLKSSGITEGLAFSFRQLSKGGGPKKIQQRVKQEFQERYGFDLSDEELRQKAREEMLDRMQQQLQEEGINVNGVTEIMEQMSRRNRDLFKLPPYVLYVSRAFSTLEGIGLSVNEDYAIIQECYPYLARRLFTDNSPRAKAALREMLFGGPLNSIDSDNKSILSPNKLLEMSSGFTSYTASTTQVDLDGQGSQAAQEALIDIVLAPEGSAVQDILIEGLAKVTDAVVRESLSTIRKSPPSQAIESLLQYSVNSANNLVPSPLKPLLLPLYLPYQLSQTVSKFIEKTPDDERSLQTLEALLSLANNGDKDSLDTQNARDLLSSGRGISNQLLQPNSKLRQLIQDPMIRKKFPVLLSLSRKYGSAVFTRAAERIEDVIKIQNPTPSNSKSKRRPVRTVRQSNNEVLTSVGSIASNSARRIARVLTPQNRE